MSLVSKASLSNSSYYRSSWVSSNTQFSQIRSPNFSHYTPPNILLNSSRIRISLLRYPISRHSNSPQNCRCIRVYDSNSVSQGKEGLDNFSFDDVLSFAESMCLFLSLAISVGYIVKWAFFRHLELNRLLLLGNRVLVGLLTGAVAVGAVIRRRQWRRVCGVPEKYGVGNGNNVIERIERLEENLRSATTILRMLSRQLEKLGVKFRLTRKTLKEPISQTAALAQRNSEATRALAQQEGILEKELAEVQKVLLAMQDQQQKQLDLILAIAKTGKLYDAKRGPDGGSRPHGTENQSNETTKQVESQQIGAVAGQKGTKNDKP